MPEIELELGAVVDVAASKDVHAVGHQVDRLTGLFGGFAASLRPLRRSIAAGAVSTAAAAGTVINLGGPPPGRLWNVVQLIVAGNDDRTVVAGATVAAYVGNANSPTLANLLLPASGTQVPNSTAWSKDQVWVHDDEQFFVVVYGAANAQQLVAVARILDYPVTVEAERI